jgi:hypothetical protein
MLKPFLLAGFALLSAVPLAGEPGSCRGPSCPQVVSLSSVSATRSYGVLLAAPETGCRRVRYRIESEAQAFLGHTPPLAPGEIAVVRMGMGFAEGVHDLTVAPEGCTLGASMARAVALRKHAPDHGWRASRATALAAQVGGKGMQHPAAARSGASRL